MLHLYAQTPKTKLTAAQMLTAARNRDTQIWSQAGHISLHPEHGSGGHQNPSQHYQISVKSRWKKGFEVRDSGLLPFWPTTSCSTPVLLIL